MIYRQAGKSGVEISAVALGGHEFLDNGSSRGFNENFAEAVKPGYVGVGYGQEKRRDLVATALDNGINFFDVTIDPEKEALGRNLKELAPSREIYIQTRPEGMGYGYDECNRKMAVYDLLKAEVQRVLRLLQRDCLDFLNIPFLQSALDDDPDYMDKIRHNIESLKQEGLIRFASADTFSEEATYLAQIDAGCFDSITINFNFADTSPTRAVFAAARDADMAVVTREVFLKGGLFKMAEEAGITDRDLLTRITLKWNLSIDKVTTAIVGVDDSRQLLNAISILDEPALTDEESGILDALRATEAYRTIAEQKNKGFFGTQD